MIIKKCVVDVKMPQKIKNGGFEYFCLANKKKLLFIINECLPSCFSGCLLCVH